MKEGTNEERKTTEETKAEEEEGTGKDRREMKKGRKTGRERENEGN